MELYKINLDNDTQPITECECSTLSKLQLLNTKNTCIFSKIAKFFIAQNGFNEQNIHIIITYNYNKREMFHNKNFIDNNSNNLKYVMKNTIILNDSFVSLFSRNQKQCLLFYAKKGDCIFTTQNGNDFEFLHPNTIRMVTFYYFKEKPNLNLYYTSETTKEREVSLKFLKPKDFKILLNPIETINDVFRLEDAKDYIDKYLQDNEDNENNRNKKYIVPIINSCTPDTNIVINSVNKDEKLNETDLIDYHSVYKNTIYDYYNVLLNYNSKEKEQLKNLLREVKEHSNNYFNNLTYEEPGIMFINKINLSEHEKFLTNITSELLEKYMNINYNPYYHDITISNGSNGCFETKSICNFIITFENTSEEEYIILKDYLPTLQSSHIYNIKPVEFNIISFHIDNLFKNTINTSKYIHIRVFKNISPNMFLGRYQTKKRPFYINDNKINNDSITNESICSEIKYTVNDCECITIFDKNIFNIEDIQKLYKNSIEKNKVIHFRYNPGLTILNDVDSENENLFKINSFVVNEFYNKRLLNIKENICNTSTTVINNQNYYFYEFIFLFQNLVSKTINELYGEHYSLNIVKCIVIGNKYVSNEENMALSYNEKYNYNKNGLVIYADININDENNTINLYSNYSHYDYDKKNTIRYIIEAVNTKNDIINVNEQKELIEFANKEYALIKNNPVKLPSRYMLLIGKVKDYQITFQKKEGRLPDPSEISDALELSQNDVSKVLSMQLHNKSIFFYEDANNSYDVEIRNIPDSEIYIKNLIENIRQRIIEKEKIVFTSEPSELPSFFQILEENAATHFHIDDNDTDNYHIRFNVIIQNAKEGGVPIYNGIMKPCQERQYIICRSGLDTHCSSIVKGDKPRIIISFGFNIPIKDIHKHPNIFYDLI